MVEQQRETRLPTTAEVHAARALGRPDPWEEIEVEATPAGVRLAGRIQPVRESRKPKSMNAADWYAQRVRGGDEGPDAA